MSKRFSAKLRTLSVDQVTDKVGDYCEKRLQVLTDRNKGSLRTAFNVLAMLKTEHAMDLIHVAAEKNGVEFNGHDTTIAAIGQAAQKRGDPAAAKILDCANVVDKIRRTALERGVTGVFALIRLGKELGPKPF